MNRWLNTLYGIGWETKYGRFTTLIPKCEHFTLLVCPFRFLVIFSMRRLGNVQSVKHTCFAFELFAMNATPARRVTPPWDVYMANCHPGWQGNPTYHVNVIKIKWEIIWTGGLPHLPGVPHLHLNRPLKALGNCIACRLLNHESNERNHWNIFRSDNNKPEIRLKIKFDCCPPQRK